MLNSSYDDSYRASDNECDAESSRKGRVSRRQGTWRSDGETFEKQPKARHNESNDNDREPGPKPRKKRTLSSEEIAWIGVGYGHGLEPTNEWLS